MKKRILYISPGPYFKPRSPALKQHFEHLSNSFEGCIFTTTKDPEDFQIGNFRFISMKYNKNIRSFFKFKRFCSQRANEISQVEGQFDLVATYDPLKTGLIGASIAKKHRLKFVTEVNGVYTSPAVWIDNQHELSSQLKKRIYPVVMRQVLKKADGIRLLFKQQIDPFMNVTQGKVIADFRLAVDTDTFHFIREDKIILFVGYPFKLKGVDVLISAFKKIASKYPDWKLKILGWYPDPTELYAAIDNHVQIFHHLPVHFDEMPEQIGTCGILVLPSRSEAMGRVLLEAMAASKPRVGAKLDGIPTVINNEVDGLLFEPENIEDLASQLDRLMGDSALRKKFGEAGRERAENEFNQEVYMKNLVNFYNQVIGP